MSNELKLIGENNTPMFVQKQMQSLEGVMSYAKTILESGLAPDHFEKPESVALVLGHGLSIGMNPSQALQQIVPINGLITIKGDGSKALIMGSKLVETWKEETSGGLANEDYTVSITSKRKDTGEEITRSFSISHAKRAGLWITQAQVDKNYKLKYSPWWKHPDRMVYYRALGYVVRDLYPDVLQGTYIHEEIIEVDYDNITTESSEGKNINIDTRTADKGIGAISETMGQIKSPRKTPEKEPTIDDPSPVKNIPKQDNEAPKDSFQQQMQGINEPSEENSEENQEEKDHEEYLAELKDMIKGHGLNLPRGKGANNVEKLEDMAHNPENYKKPEEKEPNNEEFNKPSSGNLTGNLSKVYLLLATSSLTEEEKDKVKAKAPNMTEEEVGKILRHLESNQKGKETPQAENPIVQTFMNNTFDLPKKNRSFPEQMKLRESYEEIGIDEDTLNSIIIEHNIADSTESLISESPYEDLLSVVRYFVQE